ncbi:hypothetical protein GQ53DRAFT_821685 [Thozetella sp. PMI_491]|nr:hypothetical protein GQ53DRAFT_821685 [Thozetella sp. PMI_491]
MLSVILDFDGTVTEKDTLGVLAHYFIDLNPEKRVHWDQAVERYVRDLQAFNDAYQPAEPDRVGSQAELDYSRAQRKVEHASIERVQQSGLFDRAELNLTLQNHQSAMYLLGQRAVQDGVVKIRPGFREFLSTMLTAGSKVGVLSLNWSTDFVKGVLSTVDERAPHELRYCTNNIGHRNGNICGPTLVQEAMLTGEDKMARWREICPTMPMASAVFIGDGAMDLQCMLAAKKAVVIARDPDASYPYRALCRIGHEAPPPAAVGSRWRFCCTKDFGDLARLLRGDPITGT